MKTTLSQSEFETLQNALMKERMDAFGIDTPEYPLDDSEHDNVVFQNPKFKILQDYIFKNNMHPLDLNIDQASGVIDDVQ